MKMLRVNTTWEEDEERRQKFFAADEEFKKAQELYSLGFKSAKPDRFQPLLDYYYQLTGFNETNHAAVMHHQISQYGPPCENCGKPYRTPLASFCANCGHEKS